jgi:hypothetical protein
MSPVSKTTATSEILPGYRVDAATNAWLTLPWPAAPDAKQAIVSSSLGPDIIRWAEGRTDEPGLTDYLHPRADAFHHPLVLVR